MSESYTPQHNEILRNLDYFDLQLSSFIFDGQESGWMILGGSGFVGKWLTLLGQRLAMENGNENLVTVATRDVRSAEIKLRNFLPRKFKLPKFVEIGELQDPSSFRRLMKNVDTVFHAATPVNGNAKELLDVPTISRQIIDNCRLISSPKFIHLSSGGVYTRTDFIGRQVPESTNRVRKEDAVNSYQRVKVEIEELVENATTEGIVRGVNPRLFAFGGPGFPLESKYAFADFMRSAILGRNIEIQGNPQSHRSYLHPIDMASWILSVWKNLDQLKGRPIHIGSPIPVSMHDLATTIASEFKDVNVIVRDEGKSAPEWYVPETTTIRNFEVSMGLSTISQIIESWLRYLAPQSSSWT